MLTIDLVFVSDNTNVHSSETVPPLGNSDHNRILTNLSLIRKHTPIQPCKGRQVWRYDYADWNTACHLLQCFDWSSIMSDNIEQVWDSWHRIFMSVMKQTIPSSEIKTRRNLPWLNKSLIQSMRRRNMLFKQAKRTGDFSKYKHVRNKTLEKLRSAKGRYMRQLNPKDTKRFWKVMKFLNRRVKSVPMLSDGPNVACSANEKANMLNKFFVTCFNTAFPPLSPSAAQPRLNPGEDMLCTEDEVFHLLGTLDATKASGSDGISSKMLKFTAASITPMITI